MDPAVGERSRGKGPSGIGEGGRVFGPACGPADMSLKGQRKGRGSGRRDHAGGRASEPGVVLEVRVGGAPQGRSVLGRRGAAGGGAVERALRASQVRGRRCSCPRERSEQPASVMAAKCQSTFSVLTCLCAPVFPHPLASHICPAPTNPKLSVSNA